jgi:hypothetical protein
MAPEVDTREKEKLQKDNNSLFIFLHKAHRFYRGVHSDLCNDGLAPPPVLFPQPDVLVGGRAARCKGAEASVGLWQIREQPYIPSIALSREI